MVDLFEALELLKAETAMEYCDEFNGIKSIMEHCNIYVKPFDELHFRGGNEPVINDIVQRVQDYFTECELVDKETKEPFPEHADTLRKIVMFVILNTDAVYKYNLKDDLNIVHVLDVCPLLPKFLSVALMWELHLDQQFFELLSYSPCWYSFQHFESAVDSLKFIDDPFEVLIKVQGLLRAIFVSLTRTGQIEMDGVETHIYNKLYDYSINLLKQFYTPDAEKLAKFSTYKLHEYSGYALKYFLELVLFTFEVYENAEVAKPLEDMKVFDICIHSSKTRKGKMKNEETATLKEQQMKIIKALLNALQNNVMMVGIGDFIYWVEFDVNEKQTLQEVVGVLAFKVGTKIFENNAFNHDILQQLKVIEIRPKTFDEVLNDASLDEILNALEDTNTEIHINRLWFNELINRSVSLGNEECLLSIKRNIKFMTVENCHQILNYIKIDLFRRLLEHLGDTEEDFQVDLDDMQVDPKDFKELSVIIIFALENFNAKQILNVLNYQCNLFGYNSTIFSRSDLTQRTVEFFEKYDANSSAFNVEEFLVLTFEQPNLLWQHFFENACHHMDHISTYTSTVKEARPLSNNYFQPQLMAAFNDKSYLEQTFFPALLCDIYFTLYYPDQKIDFLKQIIRKHVNEYLENEQFTYILLLVRCLSLINSHNETQTNIPLNFGEITAPVLFMAAQIMDKARWDLITYSDVRDEVLRETIQFIQNTSKKFLPNATEKDRKWITKVIKGSYKPFTQFYFQQFSLTPDQIPVEFDRFLIPVDIEEKSEAEMFFIINYVRCTTKETEWLAGSERLLPHISDAMITLSAVVNEMENPNAINNYRHCLTNYANIVQNFLLPQIEDDNKKIEKLELKVLKIIESAPSQIYEETFINFESLLLEIIKKCGRPCEEQISKNIRKYVENMKECRAKQIFLDKFQAI